MALRPTTISAGSFGALPVEAEDHTTFWQRHLSSVTALRRLYDDLGRPDEPFFADIGSMEDLDTGRAPVAPARGSDHLDF